jgi:hypothetical protein
MPASDESVLSLLKLKKAARTSRVPGTLCTAGSTRCGLAAALLGLVVLLKHLTLLLKVIAAIVIVYVRQDSRNGDVWVQEQAVGADKNIILSAEITMCCLVDSGTHNMLDDLGQVVNDNCCSCTQTCIMHHAMIIDHSSAEPVFISLKVNYQF